ncbi:helix-turn-helix transcriptional regulator [Shinella sp.]|uniref:helix-turn-helix transcriptional regulator n=1 Tax=Shinella sp. TaxID=1870904 RepID=UPI003F6F90B1
MTMPSENPAAAVEPVETLLRLRDVMKMTTLGSTTIYKKMAEGNFPRPRNLGGNVVRWRMSDVQQWIAGLPAQAPDRR